MEQHENTNEKEKNKQLQNLRDELRSLLRHGANDSRFDYAIEDLERRIAAMKKKK